MEDLKLVLKIIEAFNAKTDIALTEMEVSSINWDALYDIFIKQRVFVICYPKIKAYIPLNYCNMYISKYLELVNKIELHNGIINTIAKISENKFEYFFVKGIALSQIIYGSIYMRDPGDIDMVVRECELQKVKNLLNELNFYRTYPSVKGKNHLQKEPTSNQLGVFHELLFSRKFDDIVINLEVKLSTSAITKKNINFFWNNLMTLKLSTCTIFTNTLLYTFVHLCINAYGNSERRFNVEDQKNRLRDYIDIYCFILKYHSQINWEDVANIGNTLEALHKIRCVFIYINEIWHNTIDDSIMNLFTQTNQKYFSASTSTGSTVQWNLGFSERVLSPEDAVLNYRKLYLGRMHGSENSYWSSKVEVPLLPHKTNYTPMCCAMDSDFLFEYSFGKDNSGLHIFLRMNKENYASFVDRNIRIDFNFFNNFNACENIEGCIAKVIQIQHNGNEILADIESYQHYDKTQSYEIKSCVQIVHNDFISNTSTIDILIERNFLNYYSIDSFLPYNVFVFETLIKNTVPLLIGVRFSEKDDPEETIDMEILQL